MGLGRICRHCSKRIRDKSKQAIYLFLTLVGDDYVEAWVCGEKCLERYNGTEEEDE